MDDIIEQVKFNDDGLVTAIAQSDESGEVLMLAYMNADTLRQTLETGQMTYWSRSRQEVWVKGKTSGNTQQVKEVRLDCDGDALLFLIEQKGGAACHKGYRSCFYRSVENGELKARGERVFDPDEVYGS